MNKKLGLALFSSLVLSSCSALGLSKAFDKIAFWRHIFREVSEDEFVERVMKTATKYNLVIGGTEIKQFMVSQGNDGKITNLEKAHLTLTNNTIARSTLDGNNYNINYSAYEDLQLDIQKNSGYLKLQSTETGDNEETFSQEIWILNNMEYSKAADGSIQSEQTDATPADMFSDFVPELLYVTNLCPIANKTFSAFGAINVNGVFIVPDSFNIKYELSKTQYRYSIEYAISSNSGETHASREYKETLVGGNFLIDECDITRSYYTNNSSTNATTEESSTVHLSFDTNLNIPNIA